MKKLLTSSFFLLTSYFLYAGYADIKPGETAVAAPTAVEWSYTNDTALAAATADDVLAGFVADCASARALLAKLKGAYATDPFVLCQIGAVSQWVMRPEPCCLAFWKPSPADGRKVWIKTLLATAEDTSDMYVKMVCLDQLRWCGCACPLVLARIRLIGFDANERAVKDFSDVVVRELTGLAIGL